VVEDDEDESVDEDDYNNIEDSLNVNA